MKEVGEVNAEQWTLNRVDEPMRCVGKTEPLRSPAIGEFCFF